MAYLNGEEFLGIDYDYYSDLNAHQVAPEYSTSATYAVGDYCVYDAVLYRCTTAISTAESWTAAHWTAVKLGQEVSELKENLTLLEDEINIRTNALSVQIESKVGRVVQFNDCDASKNFFTTTGASIEVTRNNLLDTSTRIDGKILNDSGNEVSDGGSCYFSRKIPVLEGQTLTSGFAIQRFYLYDANGAFISRTGINVYTSYTVPSGVCFVQIQISSSTTGDADGHFMLNIGDSVEPYVPFESNTTGQAYNGKCIVNSVNTETIIFNSWLDEISSSLATSENPENSIPTVSAVSRTLNNLFGTATFTFDDTIITLSAELVARLKSINTEDSVTYFGKNMFDSTKRVTGKIKNDSGVEVNDSQSNYYSQYIPVNGKTFKTNFDIQRIYLYDSSKTFMSRTGAYSANTQIALASNVKFVQIQVEVSKITNSMCLVYGDDDISYKQFFETNLFPSNADDSVNIVGDGVTSVSVDIEAFGIKAVVPAVKSYPVWEPTTTTDAYKCTPLGQSSQSIPALTDTLGYIGFLETYFDIYLGEYSDGYSVTREDLGLDSGAEATDNIASPIYSYTFSPKYYNKTVLLSAGMNTCEASTYFGIAYFIKSLMEHTEDGMLALYNSTRFVVIPVICPSGIAHDPLLYPNSNNVRINKNFEYYGSWQRLKNDRGGSYPDSEVETKVLKKWLNKYAGSAFWLDCHSDTGTGTISKHIGTIFCSDSTTVSRLNGSKQSVIDFYIDKGYISQSDTVIFGFSAQAKADSIYPKTVYGYEVTKIPSAMMEQFEYSTAWGSDGDTNNDQYAIKHYVTMIRYMVLIMCRDDQKIVLE